MPVVVDGVTFTPIPVSHTVPTHGFLIEQNGSAVLWSSDTGPTQRLWEVANRTPNLRAVCIDTSFDTSLQPIADPIYALTLKDVRGQEIYGTNTYFQNQTPPAVAPGGEVEAVFDLQLNVQPGVYFISLGWVRLVNGEVQVIHRRYDVLRFDVLPRDRSFGLAHVDAAHLIRAFPDLDELTRDCPRGCTHGESEPECALDDAVERGDTDKARVESFRRLLASREASED